MRDFVSFRRLSEGPGLCVSSSSLVRSGRVREEVYGPKSKSKVTNAAAAAAAAMMLMRILVVDILF